LLIPIRRLFSLTHTLAALSLLTHLLPKLTYPQWWAAYCLIHDAAQREHPLLADYGVTPDFCDLQHLVLRDRLASDAAHAVAAYLQQRERPGRSVFSLADSGRATFDFAKEFARYVPP
jgi:hypothetical protein